MRIPSILSLPASILLIASHTVFAEEQLPAPLVGAQAKRSLESTDRRRDVEEHLRLGRNPVGVMKMSPDEGEKFYMEYWQFEKDQVQSPMFSTPLRARDEEEEARLLANASAAISFRPPFALHSDFGTAYGDLRARRAMESVAVLAALQKRDFVCPSGTTSCDGIGYPNSCCGANENCFKIQDTGLGPVGCCPVGGSCGGTITDCNAPNTACAAELGGGCCIPNFVCEGVGCVMNSVTTIVVTRTLSSTKASSISVLTTTQISTIVIASTTATATSTPSSSSSSSAFSRSSTTTSASSATGVAPVRPTSATSTTTSSTGPTQCPTGFYACDAYYAGGCCRTGRDCQTTSCPVASSTTIISTGVTVVVPVGSAATVNSPTGACASGWASCAASDGGNCCPSGWQCGAMSCSSISPTSTAVAQKDSPNRASSQRKGVDLAAILGTLILALMLV
ncbi:hypothetical protein LHYA1_G004086 [Lachnellula hyalina]|uniref:GPI anchored protein n=1 Tax=Lachnellula hyalina TaxID=1316788 RepID=A0A8H8U077_9HELO|nr:uncharacterized protein LHYA1_G004086 [Lachnellula hyalina]TVY26647.1 hypothetical protein LHYA1_G004086 [Lachnellula hyalina]